VGDKHNTIKGKRQKNALTKRETKRMGQRGRERERERDNARKDVDEYASEDKHLKALRK